MNLILADNQPFPYRGRINFIDRTVDPTTGESTVIRNRTSYGTYFHLEEDEFIATLDRRLAAAPL